MDNIKVPVSPGEVLDKITILEIKSERMEDPGKVANVRIELKLLQDTWAANITDDDTIRERRIQADIVPVYKLVDTCAAEFEAYTPYYYSTYESEDESQPGEVRKVMPAKRSSRTSASA